MEAVVKMTDPIVRVTLIGEMHVEGDKIMIGDTNVTESIVRRWGGKRQQVHFACELRLVLDEALGVSPTLTGLLAEPSEPHK